VKRLALFAALLAGLINSLLWATANAQQEAKGQEGKTELGRKAFAFFTKYCSRCHKQENPPSKVDDYDVVSYASLTKKRTDEDGKAFFYVKPGLRGVDALKNSYLWSRAGKKGVAGAAGDMPPKVFRQKKVEPQPTDEERQKTLGEWIRSGAPNKGFGPAKREK
jgi:hypothetical protein